MTITIGTFTANALTAQPFGYEGEARQGLTIRAVRFSGLLTPTQWAALTTAYNTWRNTRINDQDTLLSESVGTTINVSFSANGITWNTVPSWFDAAPQGEQVGAYIEASCILLDAAEALAVLLRQRELDKERQIAEAQDVSCPVIAAELQRRKDETDCELTALAGGLSDDFAEQDLDRLKLDTVSQATAYTAGSADLLAAETARATIEKAEKTAQLAGRATDAQNIAALDLDLERQDLVAQAAAYTASTTDLADIAKARIDIELLEYAARVTALTTGTRLEDLKTARALEAVYDKYINEDLPNLGTVTLGSAVVTLTSPMETRADGPGVALTATGVSYITGPLVAHKQRQIEGYISTGTYANVLSWYDTTIASVPATGTWFPTSTPSATAEPFLIGGVKSTRYNVTVTAVQII